MLEWLAAAGAWFTPEQYLWWTRWQCMAWTAADVVIVVALVRMANTARGVNGKQPHVFPYLVLLFTLFFVPLIFVAPTGGAMFAVELLITLPHFGLIVYLLGINRGSFLKLVTLLEEKAADA